MEYSCWLTALLLAALVSTLDADVGPRFVNNPEPLVVPLGDEVELECSLDVPADQVQWKHNGKLLPHKFNSTTKSQLIFKLDNESQLGEYQCLAWFGVSVMSSTKARLSLATVEALPPTSVNRLMVSAGNNVVMKCRVPHSSPPAVIQYYKNGHPIQGSQILNSGTLFLGNVTMEDTGQYTCSITNSYVHRSALMLHSYDTLTVVSPPAGVQHAAPQFTSLPPDRYLVQSGANITLECVAFGEPVPRVKWLRKNGVVNSTKTVVTPAGLLLVNMSLADEGVYTCLMDNGVQPSLMHHITVVYQESPSVDRGPSNVLVKEGGQAVLECSVRGHPPPHVTWLLNGESVDNDTHMEVNHSRLEIKEAEKRHAGMYQCMVDNEVGSTFGLATLRVEPRQVTGGSGQSAAGGGRDRPRHRQGPLRRQKHRSFKKLNSTEMIPPSRPTVTRLTDTSVMVRWSVQDKGLAILFLKVQYKELKGKGSRWMTNNEDIPPHVNSYEVTGLTPNSYYKFRVAAVYTNMDNQLSPNTAKFWLHKVTAKQTPPPPLLTQVTAVGPEAIQILWQYEKKRGVPVEGFYVYYRSTSTAGDYIKATVEGEATRAYIIKHLTQDTGYDIKLQSFTVDAASDFSAILTHKTERCSTLSPSVTPPSSTDTDADDGHDTTPSRGGHQLYTTLGAALGGVALLLLLCLLVYCCSKRSKHRHPQVSRQEDKPRALQLEQLTTRPHSNGHCKTGRSNGYTMNITNNPLADNDSEDKNQNVMEISFITRTSTTTTTTTNPTNNNCTSKHQVKQVKQVKQPAQVKQERVNSVEMTHKIVGSVSRSRSSLESHSDSSDESSIVAEPSPARPSCALQSDSWRRCQVARSVENYV